MIKTKVPEDVMEALCVLRGQRPFDVVLTWLRDSLEETRVQNDDLDGNDLTRNQGCAKTLAKILKSADEAG